MYLHCGNCRVYAKMNRINIVQFLCTKNLFRGEMVIKTFEFQKNINARLWIDELPDSKIEPTSVLENTVVTNCKQKWNLNKVGLELYLSRRHFSFYGLLGIQILPADEQNKLCIKVYSVDSNDKLFDDTIAYDRKTVYCGVLNEYAGHINQKIRDFMQNNSNMPPGTIVFITGAHCEVGSSKALFGMITEILLNILLLNKTEYCEEDIQKLIDDSFIFP